VKPTWVATAKGGKDEGENASVKMSPTVMNRALVLHKADGRNDLTLHMGSAMTRYGGGAGEAPRFASAQGTGRRSVAPGRHHQAFTPVAFSQGLRRKAGQAPRAP